MIFFFMLYFLRSIGRVFLCIFCFSFYSLFLFLFVCLAIYSVSFIISFGKVQKRCGSFPFADNVSLWRCDYQIKTFSFSSPPPSFPLFLCILDEYIHFPLPINSKIMWFAISGKISFDFYKEFFVHFICSSSFSID